MCLWNKQMFLKCLLKDNGQGHSIQDRKVSISYGSKNMAKGIFVSQFKHYMPPNSMHKQRFEK